MRILHQRAVPAMTAVEQRGFQKDSKAVVNLPAVQCDRFIFPFANQAKLIPSADIAQSTTMLITEDSVQLRQRQLRNGIVFVNEEHLRVVKIPDVQTAGHDLDSNWRIVLSSEERRVGKSYRGV